MFDPKKGKYTEDENTFIIETMNQKRKQGIKEREIIREISASLNRGYAGIMSHVRKLRSEYPDRFDFLVDGNNSYRLNSWEEKEEQLVIDTVNRYLEQGKSLSTAIIELEERLSRTQGAIYQRIYTLRKREPEKFNHQPVKRPRRRRKLQDWQVNRPVIRSLHDADPESPSEQLDTMNQQLLQNWRSSNKSAPLTDEAMIFHTFEERYGRLQSSAKERLNELMTRYGPTRVSIALLTLPEDPNFSTVIADFLANRLDRKHF